MFHVTLGRVRDKVMFREGGETLALTVDGDAARMVRALTDAQQVMNAIKNESTEDERQNAAKVFAEAIFGEKQAEKLKQFYNNDPVCVIEACGRYFEGSLSKKITKAQKK